MISSIRVDGSTACMTVDGATDKEVFETYVQHILSPTLQPGDIVIMDNLSPHKGASVQRLIEKAGAEILFLPSYSPDLNPIEKMWSKVKSDLRTTEARNQQALNDAIAASLSSITRQNAVNWFVSCGYSFI
jgi:transposase